MRHQEGRDDATASDIAMRPWKAQWPHYVRVHHGEFIEGTVGDGVSLNDLMATLAADAFASTQRNRSAGKGNTNPRHAYRQQAAVELTTQGFDWLNQRLEVVFASRGKLPPAALDELDWPTLDAHTALASNGVSERRESAA